MKLRFHPGWLPGLLLVLVLCYSLVTGKMIGSRVWPPVEGRISAPVLYWSYIGGLALVAGFLLFLGGRLNRSDKQ